MKEFLKTGPWAKTASLAALAPLTLALSACNQGGSQGGDVDLQNLADKIAIQDLLIDYYTHFGGSDNDSFAKYYTDDAVFDVNGIILTGHDEIVGLYNDQIPGEEEAPEAEAPEEAIDEGQFNMLLSNIQVDVTGDSATARMFWTGVMNAAPYEPPHLVEQGREFDSLEKQDDGRWLITKRVVIADSGIPEMYRATYVPRPDYDINAD